VNGETKPVKRKGTSYRDREADWNSFQQKKRSRKPSSCG